MGERIERRRLELGLTKSQLLERVGIGRWATIHDWVTGRQVPRVTNLVRLAEALQMDLVELIDDLLPEPDSDGWREFARRNADRLEPGDLIDMRVLARRRPYLSADALEALRAMLAVGAPR